MLKARSKSQPRRSRKYAFSNMTHINNGLGIVQDEGRLRYESRACNSSSTKGVPPHPKEIPLNTGWSGISEPDDSAERTWMSRAIVFDVRAMDRKDTTSCGVSSQGYVWSCLIRLSIVRRKHGCLYLGSRNDWKMNKEDRETPNRIKVALLYCFVSK